MSLLGFDPESLAKRAVKSRSTLPVLSLGQSMFLGGVNFGAVSVVVFSIWAFAGGTLTKALGEAGFYAVCALAFVVLSGIALHPLVVGRNSLGRFYLLFTASYLTYSVVWCVVWFVINRRFGQQLAGWIGALAGTVAFTLIATGAFSARHRQAAALTLLFLGNVTGYFLGDDLYAFTQSKSAEALTRGTPLAPMLPIIGKLMWGLAYGIGTGIGFGGFFYMCQEATRQKLQAARSVEPEKPLTSAPPKEAQP